MCERSLPDVGVLALGIVDGSKARSVLNGLASVRARSHS